jgi:hypothetical protein
MSKTSELLNECKRQSESCLFTSTALYAWLRSTRRLKSAFIVGPILLGGFAGWQLMVDASPAWRTTAGICALLSGLLPTIHAALRIDRNVDDTALAAAVFKNLQDRFRQAALIGSRKSYAEFEMEFRALMDRMEKAQEGSVTAPERFFRQAQAKVKKGDYAFEVDLEEESTP